MHDQEALERRRFHAKLGETNTHWIDDFSLELISFLNQIENEKVLKFVIDNWSLLSSVPNPNYETEQKNYDEDPFAQLSLFDRWQMGTTHGSHDLQPPPTGEDAFKSPDPPCKFFSFPDSRWKEFILSFTVADIQARSDSLKNLNKAK